MGCRDWGQEIAAITNMVFLSFPSKDWPDAGRALGGPSPMGWNRRSTFAEWYGYWEPDIRPGTGIVQKPCPKDAYQFCQRTLSPQTRWTRWRLCQHSLWFPQQTTMSHGATPDFNMFLWSSVNCCRDCSIIIVVEIVHNFLLTLPWHKRETCKDNSKSRPKS